MSHCPDHQEHMEMLHEMHTNLGWLVRIGKWYVAVVGAAVVLILPLLVSFFVYLASVERRVALLELRMSAHEQILR